MLFRSLRLSPFNHQIMPRPKRTVRTPLILFGEGPCDALFLGRIHDAYSDRLRDKAITKGNGGGGSPGRILRELEKTILSLGKSSTPALVLIDEDKPLDDEAKEILAKYPNIKLVFSKPQCLDGLLLDLLDDLPPKTQRTSAKLKSRFQNGHLASTHNVVKNFKQKRANLFPDTLLEEKKEEHPILREIFEFLELPLS